ncbi:M12 family metallo-peptidase [Arenibacter sp. M-2]|uniref:M12 family metallo-peptidase n=1 Tax=Arenibacter sp. M-2 TaxID=3053612 RepID=UPI002570DA0F|nr:M12 family metallo-peptidase [Arenibacter sp. M-2]MDL5515007.1 M12 family metallo-peptidase [Arenibacter sp. M-2]
MNHSFHRFSYLLALISIIFNSCGFFDSKKGEDLNTSDENQEEVFLFKGKNSEDSQLMHSIYLGKDSMAKWELPVEIDTMSTRQWAYVKDKTSTLSILADSINLETNQGLNDLERIIGFQEIYFEPQILTNLDSFKAELFGEVLEFNVDNEDSIMGSSQFWTGSLNKPNSSFSIIKSDSIYRASFYYDGDKYELKKNTQGYIIQRIDQNLFEDEAEPFKKIEIDEENNQDQLLFSDTNEFIDVLICYSKKARERSGGISYMNTEIIDAVVETNLSYANSQVKHRLRIAGTMELDYEESGVSETDVAWIHGNENIQAERDNLKADIVVFIVQNLNYCGQAYAIQENISVKFAPYAYCVVKRDCSTGYYSFGHEIGHLMGARHDCAKDDEKKPFDYSHGLVFCNEEESWRTVMGYRSSDCFCTKRHCRIPYWSNPDVTYNSNKMGKIEIDITCKSNNAKTLNNSSLVIANFRVKNQNIDL